MSTAILRGENLVRQLSGDVVVTLVRDATVSIAAGEFVAIVGPSGSGKSSLLYLLGLLDRPTSGRLWLGDQEMTGLDDDELAAVRLQSVGFVFQSHFLLPEFTALENVVLPMRRLGRLDQPAMEARGVSLLTDLGLGKELNKRPKQLSGGQSQRVAIARALANEPAVILADEPTGNLDSVSSATVRSILKSLSRDQSRAVVFVTHDRDFAAAADRVVTIVDGAIQSNAATSPRSI